VVRDLVFLARWGGAGAGSDARAGTWTVTTVPSPRRTVKSNLPPKQKSMLAHAEKTQRVRMGQRLGVQPCSVIGDPQGGPASTGWLRCYCVFLS